MVAREFTRRQVALTSVPAIRVSTAAARNAKDLANVLGGLSNELESQLDKERISAGTEQGGETGAKGPFVKKDPSTLFGRAFNDAALSSYATRMQILARTKLVELETEHSTSPARFEKSTTGFLEGAFQEARRVSPELAELFKVQMGLYQKQATGRVFDNFIKAERLTHERTISTLSDVLAHDLGIVGVDLLKGNPEEQAEALATISAGMDQLDIALMEKGGDGALKIKPEKAKKAQIELRNAVIERSIKGWFGSFDDRTEASEELLRGKFKDKNVQMVFDMLDDKVRRRVKSELIQDESRLATIANRQRDELEAGALVRDTETARDILFGETPIAEKTIQFRAIKNSPGLTTATVKMLDEFIRNGGRFEGVDIESNVLEIERKIRNGELESDIDVLSEVASQGGISFNTIRKQLIPLLEAQQDDEFKAALDEGQAILGYDKSAAAAGMFPDARRKGLLLQARMLKWKRERAAKVRAGAPDKGIDDVFEFMEKEVAGLQKTMNIKAAQSIPVLAEKYRNALSSGDAKRIAAAKTSLKGVLIEANIVDALTAATSAFDPLAAIEEHAKRIKGQ